MVNSECKKNIVEPAKAFVLIGLITSTDFQKCRYILTKLHKYYPKIYKKVDIRPMLDVEWNECILKLRRKAGSPSPLWEIQNDVVMYCDGEYFGDYRALQDHIQKKYKFIFYENWHCAASKHLMEYLTDKTNRFRQLVYLTVAIEETVIGSLLFELFNDLVPKTCENFLKRCTSQDKGVSYVEVPIHRSVQHSWVQFGGFDLEETQMADENYVIPHDRRGVLSMCNSKKHRNNSAQFFIALASAPWMDYKYVAFGQLIQGDDILKQIEDVRCSYQDPKYKMLIVKAGEFYTTWRTEDNRLYTIEEIVNHIEEPRTSIGSYSVNILSESSKKDFSEKEEEQSVSDLESSSGSYITVSTYSLLEEQVIEPKREPEVESTPARSVISLPEYLAQIFETGEEGTTIIRPSFIPGGYGYEPEKYLVALGEGEMEFETEHFEYKQDRK